MATFANALLFQITWFASVLGGAAGEPVWGMLAVAVLLGAVLGKPTLRMDLLLLAGLGVTGFALDSLWIQLGILDFLGASVAPVWIVTLWLGVALTINHSLTWFRSRPWLGAIMAGSCAPLCYLGGERLGAVEIGSTAGLGLVALAWFALFWLLFAVSARAADEGVGQQSSAALEQ